VGQRQTENFSQGWYITLSDDAMMQSMSQSQSVVYLGE
jgi:hypothetical protein